MEGIILVLHLLGHYLCLSHISPQMLLILACLISYPRILNLSSVIFGLRSFLLVGAYPVPCVTFSIALMHTY